MIVYLGRDEILDIHLIAVEHWGGRLGIRSQDRLISILQSPHQMMFGVELYPDLSDKVAVVGFQLIKHRPFFGANEATALLAMLRMLAVNDVAVDQSGIHALAAGLRQVQRSTMSRDELARWLRERCGVSGAALETG